MRCKTPELPKKLSLEQIKAFIEKAFGDERYSTYWNNDRMLD